MKHALLAMVVSLAIAACSPAGRPYAAERFFAMGTWVDVQFDAPDGLDRTGLLADIESALRDFERDYYAWGDGELANLNAALAESRPMALSDGLAALLRKARSIADRSEGCFEPGVGSLVELWGFHSTLAEPAIPSDRDIADWLQSGGRIDDIEIGPDRLATSGAAVTLDLGGIAKGEAVDRILAMLAAAGVHNALVNAGGDLRVAGRRRDRSWRVGIRSPRVDGLLGWVELHDGEAAFTSGDYERFFDTPDGRMHHILDPRTGRPAMHTQAVTVIAAEGSTADAAATAIFVAGPERWREVAARLEVRLVLRVDDSGSIEMTDAMRERVVLEAEAPRDSVIGTS
jgi:thiamine biosynthesis lipoprotein